MKPVIALVGRPNVGKSTLFNQLTRSRDALVADQPGLTRDRQFGEGRVGSRAYIVVDTGGLGEDAQGVEKNMAEQAWLAVEQADKVLFLVDAHTGLNAADQAVAQRLREAGKKVALVVNKIDGMDPELAASEFYALGFEQVFGIAASQGRGVRAMMDTLLGEFPVQEGGEGEIEAEHGIKVAVVGRPNVGKSTLVNRLLGEERVVTFDLPGTTRDSLYLPFERDGQRFTLIDTAGVRRRSRVDEAIEKFSVIKSLRAIEDAHVVIMLLDAREGISEQDAHLLGFVVEAGRALVLAVNKWDGLDGYRRDTVRRELDRRLQFVSFAEVFFISALHGTAVGDLIPAVERAYASAMKDMATPELTRLLEGLVSANPPPLVRGRRIKLRYAHQGGQNPPRVVIHGNQTGAVPANYQRYLVNAIRKHFNLVGTPLRIQFKSGDNPYAGKRNKLTKRQMEKRRRLKRHVKKSKR